MIDGEVPRRVGLALEARAPVPVQSAPGAEDALAECCQAGVLSRALCLLRLDCRACSVQRLTARLVSRANVTVYSPRVLGLRDQAARPVRRPRTLRRSVVLDVDECADMSGWFRIPTRRSWYSRTADHPAPAHDTSQRQPGVGQRGAQRLVGWSWELPAATFPALAAVRVEGRPALDADVAGGEAQDLGPSSTGQDEGEEECSIAPTSDGVRHDAEEPADFVGAQTAGDRLDGPGSLERVARVGGSDVHPDQKAVVARETGDPSADRRR